MDLSICYKLLYDAENMLRKAAVKAEFWYRFAYILPLAIAMCDQYMIRLKLLLILKMLSLLLRNYCVEKT